jgi:predicted homoserine dehydrogenase-like protein
MSRLILDGLRARDAQAKPIQVGVIGAGDFGVGLIAQLAQTPGMRPAAVADLDVDLARQAYQKAGYDLADVVTAGSSGQAADAVRAGKPVVVPSGAMLADLPLEVTCDVTGWADVGADAAARCLRAGQHVVMVNVEADVAVGAALRRIAGQAGVVYTLADGDQPSLICSLADWAAALGLELVAGGKGSVLYPTDHPHRLRVEAGGRKHSIAFVEGTKSQIEMAAAANVLGWAIDRRGLHHPLARLEEVATRFGPRESGGLFQRTPVIDFVNCQSEDGNTLIEPHLVHGVFVVVTSHNPQTLRALRSKGVPVSEDGSRALIWRPYHLVGVEAPYSIAQAVLFGIGTAAPPPIPHVEVIAVAKRDLAEGTELHGMGAGEVLGLAEMADVVAGQRLLPLGLAEGVRLRQRVSSGVPVRLDDLADPGDTACWRLRRQFGLLPEFTGPATQGGE